MLLVEGKQKDKREATAPHHEVNWSDKLLTPTVVDNREKAELSSKSRHISFGFFPRGWMQTSSFRRETLLASDFHLQGWVPENLSLFLQKDIDEVESPED